MRTFLILVSCTIWGCTADQIPGDNLQNKLSQLVINKTSDSFFVEQHTNFEWDQLYIVKPYCPSEQYFQLSYGIENLPDLGIVDFSSENIQYLIFVKRNLAVKYMMLNVYPCCDFTRISPNASIARISNETRLYIYRTEYGNAKIYDHPRNVQDLTPYLSTLPQR